MDGRRSDPGGDRQPLLIGFLVLLGIALLLAVAAEAVAPGWGLRVAIGLTAFVVAFAAAGLSRRRRR